MLSPLLPLEAAADVGVDAALIASTNGDAITFELRRVNDADVENTREGDVPREWSEILPAKYFDGAGDHLG